MDSRMSTKDMFMLLAMWMEFYPTAAPKTSKAVHPTGCILVDPRDRIVSLQSGGEAHAIVRAILLCKVDARGCDVYVSRFPCAMCSKMMVQAGIRRIYYFPAHDWEVDWLADYQGRHPMDSAAIFEASSLASTSPTAKSKAQEKKDANYRSVSRLITNNPIALTLHIPRWAGSELHVVLESDELWHLDQSLSTKPSLSHRWQGLCSSFGSTQFEIRKLIQNYKLPVRQTTSSSPPINSLLMQHAIVLAHIAAKRTDDPKIGVGAVLIDAQGSYISVGWNGYPKRSSALDYPQAGADDLVEDEELKYDYILHAGIYALLEQNALLWRCPPGSDLRGSTVVTTKMPCDECSPVLADCGVQRVVTNLQIPKSLDDPARLRGLTYEKIGKLIPDIWLFP